MSRYIDADALKDTLDYCVKEGMGSTIAFTFKHMVEDAPSIDIEPKRGEWMDKGWKGDWQFETDGSGNCWYEYECSECGFRNKGGKSNFCPNCGADMRNSSEIPNNCEHITEDGVTCAKYPACDDCLDNPLNKLKGSERLVKGSEQTEPTSSKMEQVDKDINVRSKDEPQTEAFEEPNYYDPALWE